MKTCSSYSTDLSPQANFYAHHGPMQYLRNSAPVDWQLQSPSNTAPESGESDGELFMVVGTFVVVFFGYFAAHALDDLALIAHLLQAS